MAIAVTRRFAYIVGNQGAEVGSMIGVFRRSLR
jgi:hypothetical protein